MTAHRPDPRLRLRLRLRTLAALLLGLLLLGGVSGCRWLQDEFFFIDRAPPLETPREPIPW